MKRDYKEIAESVMPLLIKEEYTAAFEKLVRELCYTDYNIDGDHGMNVISVEDIIAVCQQFKK